MLKYILRFIAVFVVYVLAGVIGKLVFLSFYGTGAVAAGDWADVIWHGLAMDCTVAGYLSAVPALLMIASVWLPGSKLLKGVYTAYSALTAVIYAIVSVANVCLYAHWGFPLDMTPVFYLTSSPTAAAASATPGEAICCILGFAVFASVIFLCLCRIWRHIHVDVSSRRVAATVLGTVLAAALFIPIRGGFTVSTMNPGRAYYSQRALLNHAAVNPAFSLLYSATHQASFGKQFRYFDNERAGEIFGSMTTAGTAITDTLVEGRPDIYLVIAESFSSHLMPSQGGEAIAVCLDSMARDGVLFDNFYASSFRTDRALPAILGAIPGQPTTSLMKYADKTEGLPSLPRALKDAGYSIKYYYGGDVNFTNMKSYLVNCGFNDIVCDKDFALADRTGKWGAHDHLLFRRVLDDARTDTSDSPHFRVIQTSSSHEPFEVPYAGRHSDPAANAFAYTDSCIGDFARNVADLPRRSLIIIVPDHYGCYPTGLDSEEQRHHVPMVFSGNALTRHGVRIDRFGSQPDLAATLLGQLGIDASDFVFSRDMLSDISSPFAFYSSPNAISLSDSTATATVDIVSGQITGDSVNADKAKAYLQKLYDYLDSL